VTKNISCELAV